MYTSHAIHAHILFVAARSRNVPTNLCDLSVMLIRLHVAYPASTILALAALWCSFADAMRINLEGISRDYRLCTKQSQATEKKIFHILLESVFGLEILLYKKRRYSVFMSVFSAFKRKGTRRIVLE